MTHKIEDEGYAITGVADNGRRFLFSGVFWSRAQAITRFCHNLCTSGANVPEDHGFGRALHPTVRAEWKKHYAKGRRCVPVTITARVK